MDVLVFGGQSNMQGQTEGLPAVNPVIRNAYEYRFLTDSLVPLAHPVGEDIFSGKEAVFLRATDGGGSLIPAFCDEYVSERGREVVAVQTAKGATVIADWTPKTERYRFLTEKINAGVKRAAAEYSVDNIYFVWFQGCSDAIGRTSAKEYENAFVELKNALKRDTDIRDFGIIRTGYFASVVGWNKNGSAEEKKRFDEEIMNAQEKVAENNGDCAVLTRVCARLSLDKKYVNPKEDGHFNNAAMEIIGRDAAKTASKIWR